MRLLGPRQRLRALQMFRMSPRRTSLKACCYRPGPKRRGPVAAASVGLDRYEIVRQLYSEFEEISRSESGVEFWLARELQPLLGYSTWESFEKVIEKARTACHNSGQDIEDHFRRVTKMVLQGPGVGSLSGPSKTNTGKAFSRLPRSGKSFSRPEGQNNRLRGPNPPVDDNGPKR